MKKQEDAIKVNVVLTFKPIIRQYPEAYYEQKCVNEIQLNVKVDAYKKLDIPKHLNCTLIEYTSRSCVCSDVLKMYIEVCNYNAFIKHCKDALLRDDEIIEYVKNRIQERYYEMIEYRQREKKNKEVENNEKAMAKEMCKILKTKKLVFNFEVKK